MKLQSISRFSFSLVVLGMLSLRPCPGFAAKAGAPELTRFLGTQLPQSPLQQAPWTPPAGGVPAEFLSATQTLFEQGLADPRGGEYRALRITVGSVWGGAGAMKVHGWLLPAPAGKANENRFAVCWNGLVYPVASVDEPADVRADMLALVQADDAMRAKAARDNPKFPFYRFRNATPEGMSASETSMLPLKASLLLRLGESELARLVWTAFKSGMRENTNDDSLYLKDSYLMLATDWTWALFDRAVCAHMRGDDRLSVLDARCLTALAPLVEAETVRRGYPRPDNYGDRRDGSKPLYLEFLRPLPVLLADEERRIARPPTATTVPVPAPVATAAGADTADAGTADANGATRVATLIDDLDEVSARQWGQPGGVSLGADLKVQALVRMGKDAVEPLIDTLEKDERLTRSVHFGRDFMRSRSLIGVHEAAYVALAGILQTSFFGVGSTGSDLSNSAAGTRHAVAESIRVYWNRYKDVPLEERWYRTLLDDGAGDSAWRQAAANIVRPENIGVVPGSMLFSETTERPLQPGERPRLAGEALRAKTNPTVAELMAKRAASIAMTGRPGSEQMWALQRSGELALNLARWDAVAARPTLQKQLQLSIDKMMPLGGGNPQNLDLWQTVARLALQSARSGDEAALPTYAGWMHRLDLKEINYNQVVLMQPLTVYPNNAAAASLIDWVWNDPRSPWSGVLQGKTAPFLDSMIKSPLVHTAGFKKYLLRELANATVIGQARLRKPDEIASYGELSISLDAKAGSMSMGRGGLAPDPLKPASETPVSFRVCDYIAWLLYVTHEEVKGAPRCELYWPERNRDAAVRESAAFVRGLK